MTNGARPVNVCDGIRTPFGRYRGGLAGVRADDLAALPLRRLLERNPALDGAALGPALQTEVYRSVDGALARARGERSLAVSVDPAGPDLRISVHSLDAATPISELAALEARLELIGGTLTAGPGELLMRIPIERGAEDLIAVFPQPRRVEIPDGERHALP